MHLSIEIEGDKWLVDLWLEAIRLHAKLGCPACKNIGAECRSKGILHAP